MFTVNEVATAFKDFIVQTTNDGFKVETIDEGAFNYHIFLNYDIDGRHLFVNDTLPLFKVSNLPTFLEKLTTLLNLMAETHKGDQEYFMFNHENFLGYLMVSSFSNMQENDFNFPLSYLNKMISAYSNLPEPSEDKLIGEIMIKGEKVEIYQRTGINIASMESPTYTQFMYKLGNDTFLSPRIHSYISKGKCYIMSMQNSKKNNPSALSKKLDRYFRKVDKGLENIERGENETIKDISPSFLIALTLFVGSNEKIKSYYFPDFLPLRYMNKEAANQVKGLDPEEVNRIQTSITNKHLLLAARLAHHFSNSTCNLDNPGYLEINFDDSSLDNDNIISDFYKAVKESKKINIKK